MSLTTDPASPQNKIKVVFFGTHPIFATNSYSKVVYNLCKHLAGHEDISLTVFGSQAFNKRLQPTRQLPDTVHVHDAFANEVPRHMGFGFSHITSFVSQHRPDVCIVYNDMVVIQNILEQLGKAPNRKQMKVIAYVDQVYLYQKKHFIQLLNTQCDWSKWSITCASI
eukprot:jgi/Chrzof1/6279/UNPLg00859.t1